MATKTTNYGLEKPDGTDFYDVDVQNSNMDIIDKQMKANANAITQLNSDSVFEERSSPNLYVKRNKDIAIVSAFFGANLTGGNTDNTYKLPNGVNFTCSLFAPCEILDQNWTPIGNSGYISVNGNKLTVRCATSISNGVVIANIVAPASLVQFI